MTKENKISPSMEGESEIKNVGDVVIVSTPEEKLSFILDILDFGNNLDSEEQLKHDNSYVILSTILKACPVFTIVVEQGYVDKIYRNSYYMHLSCKHRTYERFCKRLFLFSGNVFDGETTKEFVRLDVTKLQKKFVGTIVVRPLKEGKIGRALISPFFIIGKEDAFLRYAKYSATIYGMRFRINAFPFSMQDGETTTCAEITILNLIDYFSRKYSDYRNISPSEIAQLAEKNGYERNLPSRGLAYSVITKIFSEVGFSPRLYTMNLFADMSQFKRLMHYYIESGIPVAVGVKVDEKTRHSIVCIGHGKVQYSNIGNKIYAAYDMITDNHIWFVDSADLCDQYIVMDDGRSPYEICEWKSVAQDDRISNKCTLGEYEPDNLMVPLYQRMFLEAQDAYDICISALASSKIGIQRFCPELGTKENPVIIRLFMCSSRNYRHRRVKNFGNRNKEVCERYIRIPLPKFIWVCEVYTKDTYCEKKASGEIVIDATASPHDGIRSILLYHYPNHILVCQRNMKVLFGCDEEFERVNDWEPFSGYDHNLFLPEMIKKREYV